MFDNFMSEWTRLVGDPVMSKWIIVTLGVSILLNGYLLKGIASGSASGAGTRGAGGAAAAAAAALLGAWEIDTTTVDGALTKKKNRLSGTNGLSLGSLNGQSANKDGGLAAYQDERRREAEAQVLIPMSQRPKLAQTISSSSSVTQTSLPTPKFEKPMPELVVSPSLNHLPSAKSDALNTPANGIVIGGDSDRPQLDGLANGNGAVPLALGTVQEMRSLADCEIVLKSGLGPFQLSDEEIIMMVQKGKIPPYSLEKVLQDYERAVKIRRAVICMSFFI